MQVSEETGTYKCWACGARGDIFTWLMELDRLTFREALEQLAARAGVELGKRNPGEDNRRKKLEKAAQLACEFFQSALKETSFCLDYCERRGLSPAVRDHWKLGYSPGEFALTTHLKKAGIALNDAKDAWLVDGDPQSGYQDKFRERLMFPIQDDRGKVVAFGGRILTQGNPKYINSGDTPLFSKRNLLYGLYQAKSSIAEQNRAVLVEGYMDVIACHRAGLTNAVASLGTALSEEQARLLRRWCENVTVLYDSDEAGQKAAARSAEVLTAEGLHVKVALLPQGQDPDSLLKEIGPEAVARAAAGGMTPVEYAIARLEAQFGLGSEKFWSEVIPTLKLCRDPLELEHQLHLLAGKHPNLRDPVAAYRALRTMAKEVLRPAKRQAPRTAMPTTQGPMPMPGPERLVCEALIIPDLRETAWEFLSEPELFTSELGTQVQLVCSEAFPDAPQAADWVHSLPEGEVRTFLTDLALKREQPTGVIPVSENDLVAAVELLLKRREKARMRRLRHQGQLSDEQAYEYAERWKQNLL